MSSFTSFNRHNKSSNNSTERILNEVQNPAFLSPGPVVRVFNRYNRSRIGMYMKQCGNNVAKIFTNSGYHVTSSKKRNCFSAPQTLYYISDDKTIKESEESIKEIECPICNIIGNNDCFTHMMNCDHIVCTGCMMRYIILLIEERSDWGFVCSCCDELIHPEDICNTFRNYMKGKLLEQIILNNKITEEYLQEIVYRYYDLSFKKALNKMPGMCWCPGKGCNYAVIGEINSSCPQAKCMNEMCGIDFCTNCRSVWHPKITCKKNHRRICLELQQVYDQSGQSVVKPCPGCRAPITRILDGSCNQIKCTACDTSFCWLCLKKVNEFHYLTLTGCTFWGNEVWNKKKAFLYEIAALTTAPIVVSISAVFFLPIIATMYPYSVIKKLIKKRAEPGVRHKSLMELMAYEVLVILSTPLVTAGALSIGVCVCLGYVYIVFPVMKIKKKIKSIVAKIKIRNAMRRRSIDIS